MKGKVLFPLAEDNVESRCRFDVGKESKIVRLLEEGDPEEFFS